MERLAAAFAALTRGDAQEALQFLDGWTHETPTLSARASAYRAQALRDLGRMEEADRELTAAIRLAKQAGDTAGVATLRTLRAPISASLAALAAAEQQRKKDLGLLRTPDDGLDADELIRKANAMTDAGQNAAETVSLARTRATEPRHVVLAYLAEARGDSANAASLIRAAHIVADNADDHNLVTAVAHAARAAGVRLDAPTFG